MNLQKIFFFGVHANVFNDVTTAPPCRCCSYGKNNTRPTLVLNVRF